MALDITLRDNGTGTFDIALSDGEATPDVATLIARVASPRVFAGSTARTRTVGPIEEPVVAELEWLPARVEPARHAAGARSGQGAVEALAVTPDDLAWDGRVDAPPRAATLGTRTARGAVSALGHEEPDFPAWTPVVAGPARELLAGDRWTVTGPLELIALPAQPDLTAWLPVYLIPPRPTRLRTPVFTVGPAIAPPPPAANSRMHFSAL